MNLPCDTSCVVVGKSGSTSILIGRMLFGVALLLATSNAFAITPVHGTIHKRDSAAKIIVVKAEDGTEHTFHFLAMTAVHGA